MNMTIRLGKSTSEEEVLFDADKDNDGKGVSPEQIIKILNKISQE